MDWSLTWIIGGGPSAGHLNSRKLTGGVRLGVNDAAFYKPCDAFFSNDHNYAQRILVTLKAFRGERHLSIKPAHLQDFAHPWLNVWTRVYEDAPTLEPGKLASGGPTVPGCSGYVALNLAAQMGAKRIVLFGYDFDPTYRYFFKDAPYPRVSIDGVIASFDAVAPWYAAQGIEVLNANPGSRIKAFRRISHQDAYRLGAT